MRNQYKLLALLVLSFVVCERVYALESFTQTAICCCAEKTPGIFTDCTEEYVPTNAVLTGCSVRTDRVLPYPTTWSLTCESYQGAKPVPACCCVKNSDQKIESCRAITQVPRLEGGAEGGCDIPKENKLSMPDGGDCSVLVQVGPASTGTIGAFIPASIINDPFHKYNRDTGIFILLAINIAKYLFTIIGAIAVAAGIYGGFVVLLSEGSAEKLKQGWGAIMAAFIGILIAFSAYLLVSFVANALGVTGVSILK